MKTISYLALVALSILSGCRLSINSRQSIKIDDSQMVDIVLSKSDKINPADHLAYFEIVPLESSGRLMVGSVDDAIVTDDKIIIIDARQSHSIFIFDRDGKHHATINRRGRGPQEYVQLSDAALTPDEEKIAVLDNEGSKVLFFSMDGKYVSTTPIPFWFNSMKYVDADNIVCATYGVGVVDEGLKDREDNENLLWFTDQHFTPQGSSMPPRYEQQGMVITPNIRKCNDHVWINRPYCDTVFMATPDGLRARYRLDLSEIGGVSNPNPNISGREFNALAENKALFTGANFIESGDYILIGVRTPEDGRVENYLYSKTTGKTYFLENDFSEEDIIKWFLIKPVDASAGGNFASVINGFQIYHTGTETLNATMQHPELTSVTEDSNPVVLIYQFKDL